MMKSDPRVELLVPGPVRRKPRRRNNLYALEVRDRGFLPVRLLADDAVVAGMHGMYVLGVYESFCGEPAAIADRPPGATLLLPPIIVNRSCFTHGYLQFVVDGFPLRPEDEPRLLFRDPLNGKLYDHRGHEQDEAEAAFASVGKYSIKSYVGLDRDVRLALRGTRSAG